MPAWIMRPGERYCTPRNRPETILVLFPRSGYENVRNDLRSPSGHETMNTRTASCYTSHAMHVHVEQNGGLWHHLAEMYCSGLRDHINAGSLILQC